MIKAVEMTVEDRGWKGHVGRLGQRFVVRRREEPPPHVSGQHRVFGKCFTVDRAHCRDVPMQWRDVVTIVRALPDVYRGWRIRRLVRDIERRSKVTQG